MASTLRAKDIMRRDVITVRSGMDVWELAHFLTANGITGAPVVDDGGGLVGVVSQTDVLRYLGDLPNSRSASFDFYAEAEGESSAGRRWPAAKDLMNPAVIAADEETTIQELALIMTKRRIHRIIITREKKIVGIVATMDLIRVL